MKVHTETPFFDPTAVAGLNITTTEKLHDLTDQLSSCGVGKIVDLPQIIVVGDQSAGKSSVLEAISRIRFPVKGGVCTRFATELVLRRHKRRDMRVSVRFAEKSKPTKIFAPSDFANDNLEGVIEKAKELMGLSDSEKGFSRDVLRLEIDDPDVYPLTLVDLPGIFQVNTSEQSMDGKKTVDLLVEEYMQNPNSIILVVVTATNQLANQGILRLAEKHDPTRDRTVGIITKPDLAEREPENERAYIRLAQNKEKAHKLSLGWHVLRNRAGNEQSLDERDAIERDFFTDSGWAAEIPAEDLGVDKLREKLGLVSYQHVRKSIPRIIQDIEKKLSERNAELSRMGPARTTKEEMRTYLISVAASFQRLAQDGVEGRYNNDFFGDLDSDDYKLRAQLCNFNTLFNHTMVNKGAKQVVVEDPNQVTPEPQLPKHLHDFSDKYPYDFDSPEPITRSELKAKLEVQAAINQGREFPGMPNMQLVTQAFKRQSSPWKEIAKYHIDQVLDVARIFIEKIFEHIVGPIAADNSTERILNEIVDKFFTDKEKLLSSKLEELFRPYSDGHAVLLDHEFRQAMPEKLAKRFYERMSAHVACVMDDEDQTISVREIGEVTASVTNELKDNHFSTEEVMYMSNAYYTVNFTSS